MVLHDRGMFWPRQLASHVRPLPRKTYSISLSTYPIQSRPIQYHCQLGHNAQLFGLNVQLFGLNVQPCNRSQTFECLIRNGLVSKLGSDKRRRGSRDEGFIREGRNTESMEREGVRFRTTYHCDISDGKDARGGSGDFEDAARAHTVQLASPPCSINDHHCSINDHHCFMIDHHCFINDHHCFINDHHLISCFRPSMSNPYHSPSLS
jgi:hypothetical protein